MSISSGPIVRNRTTQKQYDEYRRDIRINQDCVFCDPSQMEVTRKFKYFVLLGNRFCYDLWDACKVRDHLMIVPIRHLGSLSEMTPDEQAGYMFLLAEYESKGYSFYSRAPESVSRTIDHLHTHLMMLDDEQITSLIYIKRPHVLMYRK